MKEEVSKNNENYNILLNDFEKKAVEFDETLYDLLSMSNGTMEDINKIKKSLKYMYGYKKDYFSYKLLDVLIHSLTSEDSKELKADLCRKISFLDIVKSIKNMGNSYMIATARGVIKFSPITSINNNDVQINPIITDNEEIINDSLTKEDWRNHLKEISNIKTRIGNCHKYAIDSSRMLREYFDIDNSVVTGYTYYSTELSKYLHSWNEFKNKQGDEMVFDSTLNAIMNKEGYYLLRHVEPICKIDSKQLADDFENYGEYLNIIDIKNYLKYRDKVIEYLKIKKDLFQSEDEEELKAEEREER